MSPTPGPISQLVTTVDKLVEQLTSKLTGPRTNPYPGMDVMVYPGDDVMQALFDSGSFCWTAYYFAPTPDRKNKSWLGKREVLVEQGWGLAPVYMGQQQDFKMVASWDKTADHPEGAIAAAQAQADIDAADAATLALAEHFPTGTVIFLDVEPAKSKDTAAYAAYVARWFAALPTALPSRGDLPAYQPGLYVNWNNKNLPNFQLPAGAPVWYAHAISYAKRGKDAAGKPKITEYAKQANVLDVNGWSLSRSPDDSSKPCQMWQWGLDVVLSVDKCGYKLTDYDGKITRIPSNPVDGLDYDTSWVSDPSADGGGSGVINTVSSITLSSAQPTVVGGNDAPLMVTLAQPAAHPSGVKAVVSGGDKESSEVVQPGQTQVLVSVPTDPVSVLTPVTFTATTAWWPHSRAFAALGGQPRPAQPSVTVSITP